MSRETDLAHDAAQLAADAAQLIVHVNPVQCRALLRIAAELFEEAGQPSMAATCRNAVERLKEAETPRQHHRPGLSARRAEGSGPGST